jgi:uncharacterized membrane protein YfcA
MMMRLPCHIREVRPPMNLSDPRWPTLAAVVIGLVGGYLIIQNSPLSWAALLLSTALIAGVLYLVLRKRKPNAPRPRGEKRPPEIDPTTRAGMRGYTLLNLRREEIYG